MVLDFSKIRSAYVIGIKGSGIVGIVEILQSMGIEISGSDTEEKFITDEVLKKLGIKYFEGFSKNNIPEDVDLVIYSTAYNAENNEEFRLLKEKKFPMFSYPEILAELFNQKYGLAVTGTHGKTTTSALLASVLKFCSTDPQAVIGSCVNDWGSNALAGKGEYFVIEADEFQNKLKLYEPKAAIVTSCDWDHPDFFRTFATYKEAFSDFVAKIPRTGFLVIWGDSVATNEIACSAQGEILKYGFSSDNDVVVIKKDKQKFDLNFLDKNLGEFEINLIGDHNILNAAAVAAFCYKLNLDLEKIRAALKEFSGISRRFEIIGKRNGAVLIDDYGHHPEEIKATLKGAREFYPEKNLIAIFHPHSYSRTEALLQDFAQSFDMADKVIVLDIYGSAREYFGSVSSNDLVKLINTYSFGKADYIPTIEEVIENLKDKIGENDIVLCIGAGNGREVAEKLKQ